MAQWKSADQANGAPVVGVEAKVSANGEAMFGNTVGDAFLDGKAVGVFGVSAAETANTLASGITHAGWVKRSAGQGPVVSVTVAAGGTGYTNGAVTFGAGVGNANATGTQLTNGSGVIQSITITAGGRYVSTPTITANGAGSGATLTVVMGGRANRVHHETLVAMGSMTGDASDDSLFPDA